jgi:2-iminobutanoate/2-iminopropanoate deaminase
MAGNASFLVMKEYLADDFHKMLKISKAVVTDPGRTVYLSGQSYPVQEGEPIPTFATQARFIFEKISSTLEEAGGSIADMTTMTVFMTDPRYLLDLKPIREEFFEEGKYPASAAITVHSLPRPGMLLEIQAIAVISD